MGTESEKNTKIYYFGSKIQNGRHHTKMADKKMPTLFFLNVTI